MAFSCLERPPPGNFSWQSFSFQYTTTATSALLSLSSQINGSDFTYRIDNIEMRGIPEPSSMGLLGIGGVLGAAILRHRKKLLL